MTDDHHEQDVAQDRQQRPQPRPPAPRLALRLAGLGGFGEPEVDPGADQMPDDVRDQQDHDRVDHAAQDPGRVACRASSPSSTRSRPSSQAIR